MLALGHKVSHKLRGKPQNTWLLVSPVTSPALGCLPIWFVYVDRSTRPITSIATGPTNVFSFIFQSTVVISIPAAWTVSNT